jgi:hypothetical protein
MKYHFKEGDTVNHIGNMNLDMTVKKILKQYKQVPTGERDEDGKKMFKDKEFMLGIECGWWENDKKYTVEKFHSNKLVLKQT